MNYKKYASLDDELKEEYNFNKMNDRVYGMPILQYASIIVPVCGTFAFVFLITVFVGAKFDEGAFMPHLESVIASFPTLFYNLFLMIAAFAIVEFFNVVYRAYKEYRILRKHKQRLKR